LRALGRAADVANRYVSLPDGLSYEAAMLLTAATPTDDSTTLKELGMTWRCPKAAIVESVRSMHESPSSTGLIPKPPEVAH
jgi:hypothetical protein